jgi:hypothetical protein
MPKPTGGSEGLHEDADGLGQSIQVIVTDQAADWTRAPSCAIMISLPINLRDDTRHSRRRSPPRHGWLAPCYRRRSTLFELTRSAPGTSSRGRPTPRGRRLVAIATPKTGARLEPHSFQTLVAALQSRQQFNLSRTVSEALHRNSHLSEDRAV